MFPCWLRLVQETVKASLPWLCDAHILGEEDIIVPIISQWLSHCLAFSWKKILRNVSLTDEQKGSNIFKEAILTFLLPTQVFVPHCLMSVWLMKCVGLLLWISSTGCPREICTNHFDPPLLQYAGYNYRTTEVRYRVRDLGLGLDHLGRANRIENYGWMGAWWEYQMRVGVKRSGRDEHLKLRVIWGRAWKPNTVDAFKNIYTHVSDLKRITKQPGEMLPQLDISCHQIKSLVLGMGTLIELLAKGTPGKSPQKPRL